MLELQTKTENRSKLASHVSSPQMFAQSFALSVFVSSKNCKVNLSLYVLLVEREELPAHCQSTQATATRLETLAEEMEIDKCTLYMYKQRTWNNAAAASLANCCLCCCQRENNVRTIMAAGGKA